MKKIICRKPSFLSFSYRTVSQLTIALKCHFISSIMMIPTALIEFTSARAFHKLSPNCCRLTLWRNSFTFWTIIELSCSCIHSCLNKIKLFLGYNRFMGSFGVCHLNLTHVFYPVLL